MTLLGLSDGDEAACTDIAEAMRMCSHAPTADLHELWRRIVFNVMVSNLDDHLRNHSFLYDRDDKWRLSPAYDLNPAPLADKARELTTGPDADLDLARNAAPYFALDMVRANAIINEVATALDGRITSHENWDERVGPRCLCDGHPEYCIGGTTRRSTRRTCNTGVGRRHQP